MDLQRRGDPERLAAADLHQPDRDSEDDVQHDVLDHGNGEHDARKARAKQTDVVHDPRDHRDARDRYRHPEHECERRVVTGGADEAGDAQSCHQPESRRERQDKAERRDQPDRPHGITLQKPAHLSASGEHQQQQAKLIDGPQGSRRRAGGREDPVLNGRKGRAESRRPEEQATDNLPDGGRLAKTGEQRPDTVRGQKEHRQRDQQTSKINISERHLPLPPAGFRQDGIPVCISM